ncbi:MAG: hypothetical protein A2V64_00970 [Bacteroidetes bacterium RBG_13_43_22]|nr:MAG: hypothetical protein A2V64_00970 [Bacteroidetes bacterium RBG_13_43_22]
MIVIKLHLDLPPAMKNNFLFSILLISSLLVSCEKEKQLNIENEGIDLISQILINGEVHQEYSYNELNLISEEKSKFFYTRHSYNDNNQLTTSEFYLDPAMFSSSSSVIEASMSRTEWVNPTNTTKSLTQEFEYDGENHLTRKKYIRPSVTDTEYSIFTYENDMVVRQSMYWHSQVSTYTEYFYDPSGNLVKENRYRILEGSAPELITTLEYEFDKMKNPYLAFRRLLTPGKFTNQNNIIKETYTIHFEVDSSIDKVQVRETTYKYNDRGYPIRVGADTEYVYK